MVVRSFAGGGGGGGFGGRALPTSGILFLGLLVTVKRDTEKNCNQISWKLRSLSGES
jgi:hypothetical protein